MFPRESEHKRPQKISKRIFGKGVDKTDWMWYNKSVPKGNKKFLWCLLPSVEERGLLWLPR
jgi:hypothetical protein